LCKCWTVFFWVGGFLAHRDIACELFVAIPSLTTTADQIAVDGAAASAQQSANASSATHYRVHLGRTSYLKPSL
jgi:hypothetical protein